MPSEKTVITRLLGFVTSPDDIEIDGTPLRNNSRWVFDVEHPSGSSQVTVVLELPYASSYTPKVLSYALCPLSRTFWGAGVYLLEEPPLTIILCASHSCRYRVTIDSVVR